MTLLEKELDDYKFNSMDKFEKEMFLEVNVHIIK